MRFAHFFIDRPVFAAVISFVTIIAGASKQPQWLFLTMVFAGRLIQFLAIAFVLHGLSWF